MNSIINTTNTSDKLDSWASSDTGVVIDELVFKSLPWSLSDHKLVHNVAVSQHDYFDSNTYYLFET